MENKTFKIIGNDISDGYHTFSELYDHRCLLYLAWLKAGQIGGYWVRDHFEGWDLVFGILHDKSIEGWQLSYHIPVKYRDIYKNYLVEVPIENNQWDGHTSADVVARIEKFLR